MFRRVSSSRSPAKPSSPPPSSPPLAPPAQTLAASPGPAAPPRPDPRVERLHAEFRAKLGEFEAKIQAIVREQHELVSMLEHDDLTLRLLAGVLTFYAGAELVLPSWELRLSCLGLFLSALLWRFRSRSAATPEPAPPAMVLTTASAVALPPPAALSTPVSRPIAPPSRQLSDLPSTVVAAASTPASASTVQSPPQPAQSPQPPPSKPPPSKPHVAKDTWGCKGHLSLEQMAALQEMQRLFGDAKCKDPNFCFDELTLLRFLRARKFDVEKARHMLHKHLDWCDRYMPSLVTAQDVKSVLKCGLARIGPMTKEGLPCVMIKVEFYDPAAFDDIDLFVRYCCFFFYRVVTYLPPGAEKGVLFFDMKGWSLFKHATRHSLKLIGTLIKIIQDHNPERLQLAVLFNAPAIFSGTWSLIKSLLDPVVAAKVIFVNDKSQVLDLVEAALLPAEYGGLRSEPYPIDGVEEI